MAQFFKEKANKSKQLSPKLSLNVTQLDHLGAGMAQHQGKVVFIPQALPGERVSVQLTDQKKSFAKAKLIKIEQQSPERADASCPHYGHCGGCDLQHLALDAQQNHKQQSLNELMVKFSGSPVIDPQVQAAPLVSPPWHYRRRARLATYFNNNDKSLKLGFRALSSKQIVPIKQCPVLAEPLSALINPFSLLLARLKAKASLGHLELTQADNGTFAVLRVTKVLPAADIRALASFALTQGINLLLQDDSGALTDVMTMAPAEDEGATQVEQSALTLPEYALSQGQVSCQFTPGNFVQVNAEVNQRMVEQAVNWLDLQVGERVLDLFCGVGNFSLALANRGQNLDGLEVIGVEGVPEMVQQARENAKRNNLANLSFYHADLSADLSNEKWLGKIDKLLLDPARAGAFESLQWLQKMKPKKVVYVSCNPASLARDSSVLLSQGYQLKQLSMIDMFPQTHHIEAMALFEIAT
ncbi:23S rRNA (uracil-5-)-methyltransferase RumA [Shewanella denitrificans OS217]|jgi:23S rRNA (uracil1939-C5)-methyltransferase|uniref:23S rRNA (uracil(1939)-C(5))-methyltransferase RlmD n=1 Tax=Shewanella denitrificans (strain OS217 / ATCC BAA-1090 / DSM 15013) TaxID=318161 RepID=RLMD_SHEDO|nr:23S rRNA (uracil(1939)-C(5))-methyltransferase RlmD [Shewanella denitrificans]Q12PZ8.1 RecName: Full=23S rRNA (uracil(1939)-C(5))-methyltransferase RlmD; AltName: Full=23S rRNA(m5U1939)-methyltransferase [Shewanella denitrificans OS217]ABE54478.1 23S rRNA (uracil-5-)-methyltransferase RumA [Shewanella denitrificans OS217]